MMASRGSKPPPDHLFVPLASTILEPGWKRMMTKRGLLWLWMTLSFGWVVFSSVVTSHDWVWGYDHPDPSLRDWLAYLAIVLLPPIGGLLLMLCGAFVAILVMRCQRLGCPGE